MRKGARTVREGENVSEMQHEKTQPTIAGFEDGRGHNSGYTGSF